MTHIEPLRVVEEKDYSRQRRYIHYAAWIILAGGIYAALSLNVSETVAEVATTRGDKLAEGFNRCISGKKEVAVQIDGNYFIITCKAWPLEAPVKK